MEGNESNLFADRMKDRGISWTIKGAQRMGKAIELVYNGDLSNWCGRRSIEERKLGGQVNFDMFSYKVSLPVFGGPDGSKPWARVLKELTSLDFPIN